MLFQWRLTSEVNRPHFESLGLPISRQLRWRFRLSADGLIDRHTGRQTGATRTKCSASKPYSSGTRPIQVQCDATADCWESETGAKSDITKITHTCRLYLIQKEWGKIKEDLYITLECWLAYLAIRQTRALLSPTGLRHLLLLNLHRATISIARKDNDSN